MSRFANKGIIHIEFGLGYYSNIAQTFKALFPVDQPSVKGPLREIPHLHLPNLLKLKSVIYAYIFRNLRILFANEYP